MHPVLYGVGMTKQERVKHEPLPFEFLKGIRCYTNVHGRWYAASDVAKQMRSHTGSVTRRLPDEDVRMRYTQTEKGYRDMAFISERALFQMVFRGTGTWAENGKEEIAAILAGEQPVPSAVRDIMDLRDSLKEQIAELESRRDAIDVQLAELKRQL